MRDRFSKKSTLKKVKCPLCGNDYATLFESIGMTCPCGASISIREMTECGHDVKKMKKICRKRKGKSDRFHKRSWDVKKKKQDRLKELRREKNVKNNANTSYP